MKKIILVLLFVVTIPITCLRAQAEFYIDTCASYDAIMVHKVGSDALWNTYCTMSDTLRIRDTHGMYYWLDTGQHWQHAAPLFFEDSAQCKVVMMGDKVILKIEPGGNLWYMPSAFCHCPICRNKNKLIYYGRTK